MSGLYRHVLCAIDLDDKAVHVLRRAAALAGLASAELNIVHVVEYVPPLDMDYIVPPVEEVEAALLDAAHTRLEKLTAEAGIEHGRREVVSGRPGREIVRLAAEREVDLIVVGRHKRHGLVGVPGSTSERVVRDAPCDTLVVF